MNARPEPAVAFPHDAAYKAMYSHPEAIVGLRHYLGFPTGPLSQSTIDSLDFERAEKLPTEWVTEDFRRRYGDLAWRIPFRTRKGARSQVWLILLLEFQSEEDGRMTLRVYWYASELWRDLEAQGVLAEYDRRTLLLPVVIHNGATPWRSPRRLADWTLEPFAPNLQSDLLLLQPSVGLHAVDFPSLRMDDLIKGNLTSLQIGFEYAGAEDFAGLLPALADLPSARLRHAAYNWVRLRAEHYFGISIEPMEEKDMGVPAFRSRLDENMKRATEVWFADGRSEGLELGRAEGIEQGRNMGIEMGIERQRSSLEHQMAVKFGPDAAQRLAPLLAEVAEWDALSDLSIALIKADAEADMVAELERVRGARPSPSRAKS